MPMPVSRLPAFGHPAALQALGAGAVDKNLFAPVRHLFQGLGLAGPRPEAQMPAPPCSLHDYLGLTGYSRSWEQYDRAMARRVRQIPLDHYGRFVDHRHYLARGASKDCYGLDRKSVLLVAERSGRSIHHELMMLGLLKQAGFPVARIHEVGSLPSRYWNGDGSRSRSQAMVQERLRAFVMFRGIDPHTRRAFLESGLVNHNTLHSLLTIRHLMRHYGLAIGDLQGGLRRDGSFVLVDPTDLQRASLHNVSQRTVRAELDRLIADVRRKLQAAG